MQHKQAMQTWAGYSTKLASISDFETKLALENEQENWSRTKSWFASINDASDVIYCNRTGQPIGLLAPWLKDRGFNSIAPQWLNLGPDALRDKIDKEPVGYLSFLASKLFIELAGESEGVLPELERLEQEQAKLQRFYCWAIEAKLTPAEYNCLLASLAHGLEIIQVQVKSNTQVAQTRRLLKDIFTRWGILFQPVSRQLIKILPAIVYGCLTGKPMPDDIDEAEELISHEIKKIQSLLTGDRSAINYHLTQTAKAKAKPSKVGSKVYKRAKEVEQVASKLEGLF